MRGCRMQLMTCPVYFSSNILTCIEDVLVYFWLMMQPVYFRFRVLTCIEVLFILIDDADSVLQVQDVNMHWRCVVYFRLVNCTVSTLKIICCLLWQIGMRTEHVLFVTTDWHGHVLIPWCLSSFSVCRCGLLASSGVCVWTVVSLVQGTDWRERETETECGRGRDRDGRDESMWGMEKECGRYNVRERQ